MLPSDFEALLDQVNFRSPADVRKRLLELAGDDGDTLALVRITEELSDSLKGSPDPDSALIHLDRFTQARGSKWELYQYFSEHPAALESFIAIVSSSNYLADVLVRNPEYLPLIYDTSLLSRIKTKEQFHEELEELSAAFQTSAARLDSLRRYRRQEILRIGSADILGHYDLQTVTEQLSRLADVVVEICLCEVSNEYDDIGFFVLALGKLGGNELNYSSDIDLIYVTENFDYLDKATLIARELTQVLGEFTSEGFLYRVDLRLRPYASSGALIVSTGMLEEYLAVKADPAERQAMLKARPIAGEIERAKQFLQQIKPVLYSDAIQARSQIRKLKERIERQLTRKKGMAGNVKLAPGGIRDIEFIVQSLQLEAGQDNPKLHTGNTLDAISVLIETGALSHDEAMDLREAYKFLRIVEHRMQMMNNRQVHQLPKDEYACLILARIMGYCAFEEGVQFINLYNDQAGKVRTIFDRILPAVKE